MKLVVKKYAIFICLVNFFALHAEEQGLDKQTYTDIAKENKYLNGSKLEEISFYAPESACSNKRCERKGKLLRRKDAIATVLVCHGYMTSNHDVGFLRMIFPECNVMTFDFRAHGESCDNHQLCTFGRDESFDVMAAVDFIKADKELSQVPRIVYGFSMGAVASIIAQSKDMTLFDAMILDCPFDRSENVLRKVLADVRINLFGYSFGLPGRRFLGNYAFNPYVQSLAASLLKTIAKFDSISINTQIGPVNPADAIKDVSVPCFFIHCRNDEKVTVEAVSNVYNNAKGFKRLWVTDGRRHFDSFFYNPEEYVWKTNRFIAKVVTGKTIDKQSMKVTGLLEKVKNDKTM